MNATLSPLRDDATGGAVGRGTYVWSASILSGASLFFGNNFTDGWTGTIQGQFNGPAAEEFAAGFNINDAANGVAMTGMTVGAQTPAP